MVQSVDSSVLELKTSYCKSAFMTINYVRTETMAAERPVLHRSEISAGDAALLKIEQYQNVSMLKQPEGRGSVNKLCWDDIELGRLLDEGSFSCVYEATLRRQDQMKQAPTYAIKHLRSNLIEQEETFVTGVVDLALEANILAKLMHPNIIRLHGCMSGCISESFRSQRGFFIILDLLSDTLDKSLTRWRRETNMGGFPFRSRQNNRSIRERIEAVALGVADGMDYIHSRRIIYRDLKPHNIGFDEAAGTVKIFDFGFAREVDSKGNPRKMTGGAGTPRYMAPEVARNKKYGFPSDVYSFSILLWEILTLNKPFDHIKTLPQFHEEVVRRHDRPSLKRVTSPELKTLLEQCWDEDQAHRPKFSKVCQVLRTYLSDSEQKSPRFLRYQSTLSTQRSSFDGDEETMLEVDSTPAAHVTEFRRSPKVSANETPATNSLSSSRMSSWRTNSPDQESEHKPRRFPSVFRWRRKTTESLEFSNPNRSYKERSWVQRKLLRQPTMSLDLSSKSHPKRRFDLGRPGSFLSIDSFRSLHSDEEGGGRCSSISSDGSTDRPRRRRSSGKLGDSHIEAMAAALAAEVKSNRQILRSRARVKGRPRSNGEQYCK